MRIGLDGTGPHGCLSPAITTIAAMIGCQAKTRNDRVKKAEVDSGRRADILGHLAKRMKALERLSQDLRQSDKNLRKASAYFAMAKHDRRSR
ncbi:hypothetical protein [Salipiger mangrovisoli]|uniref:Transposase n=1 Tax=Salipiger mangrovisoli TaxID=2865933 RepID=A0ABR9WYE4_9RHOB|nr:hypothetical protein [Salipiger mangrovisoli]MBE9636306.1 hypothetical protein [Salipiger mangrovisoli]